MSWSKRILITLAFVVAVLLIPFAGLLVFDFYERTQNERFYDARPMLKKMNDATEPYRDDKQKQILLDSVPRGSSRLDATDFLSKEGMRCERPVGTSQQHLLVCVVRSPRMRWYIEVAFDESDKVSNGRVLQLK